MSDVKPFWGIYVSNEQRGINRLYNVYPSRNKALKEMYTLRRVLTRHGWRVSGNAIYEGYRVSKEDTDLYTIILRPIE